MNRFVRTLAALLPGAAGAHQPVMDMAPRWSGGSGLQVRYESLASADLWSGGSRVDNPLGLTSARRTTWVEGVYTFDRSVRVTFKQPYHRLERRVQTGGGAADLDARGLGDLILALPIKHYANQMDYTWNLALNPSVTLPTGETGGALPLGRGTVDYGLSVSYAREAAHTFGLWDLFTKVHTEGFDGRREGHEIGFDMNVGFYPWLNSAREFSMLLLWGTHVRHERKDRPASGAPDGDSGGVTLEMAPIFVVLWRNYAFRLETYFPVYRRLNGTQLVNDYAFQVGVGMTFPSWPAD